MMHECWCVESVSWNAKGVKGDKRQSRFGRHRQSPYFWNRNMLFASAGAAPAQSPQSDCGGIDPPLQRVLLSKLATKPFCGEASLVKEVAEDANMKNFPVLSISWSQKLVQLFSERMLSFVALLLSGRGPKSELLVVTNLAAVFGKRLSISTDDLVLLFRSLLSLSFVALCLPAIFPCPGAVAAVISGNPMLL
ncbi:hypothetical protein ACHAXH_006864 [Discostella pseudostelligera]